MDAPDNSNTVKELPPGVTLEMRLAVASSKQERKELKRLIKEWDDAEAKWVEDLKRRKEQARLEAEEKK